nr:FAD-dependent oxidoreductase [Candidatus Sigynarchaeota archaeon]
MLKEIKCDALVIGAGPAGLTAAIYLKRANRDVLVVRGKEKSALEIAHEIKNYPGIKNIKGSILLAEMTEHAVALGVKILDDDVLAITADMNPKMASTKTAFITTNAIVIATGKGTRKPVLHDEEKFIGYGVSYCATCDGPLYKERPIAIVGTDTETAEDVLLLHQMGSKVTWLLKDKKIAEIEAKTDLIQEILAKKIPIIERVKVMRILGTDRVTGVEYDVSGGKKENLNVDCVFVMSSVPTAMLLKRSGLAVSEMNAIIVNRNQQTNLEGIFACGDVCGNGLQVSIAVGEGAVAGMNAAKYLLEIEE